jgi:hypothetical protein
MLTNISIYWLSGCIASSIRLYKETLANRKEMAAIYGGYCATPTGAAILPAEIVRPPHAWAAAMYNLQQWTELDKARALLAFALLGVVFAPRVGVGASLSLY